MDRTLPHIAVPAAVNSRDRVGTPGSEQQARTAKSPPCSWREPTTAIRRTSLAPAGLSGFDKA